MDNTDITIGAYKFSVSIVRFINSIKLSSINNSLIIQLLRSATSIGANIIEAKSAHSKKDFIKFYEISLKSSNETKYWLCLLRNELAVKIKMKLKFY
jgi:four helix bundle protein